jgi:lipid-A-disaccharide synthase
MSKIKRAVSHVLALFPFEPALYEKAGVPVTYVGHPLADELPLKPNKTSAREILKIEKSKTVIAMLPGSRQSEVQQHADLFVKTAQIISQDNVNTQFLVPLITRETRQIFENALYKNTFENLDMDLLFGHAHDAMEAADVVLVASGTATLEAALLKRPMVITYRMPKLSWWILKHMNYLPYVGLPNILAGKFLVPELLQNDATPQKLADAVSLLLVDKNRTQEIKQEFTDIHQSLKQNSAKKAAETILSYL